VCPVVDRSFSDLSGSLDSVTVTASDGLTLDVAEIGLSGTSSAITATGSIDGQVLADATSARLRAAGFPADSVVFRNGQLEITVAGQTISTRLSLADAGLVLQAVRGALGPGLVPDVTLLPVSAGPGWRLSSLESTGTGVRITAVITNPVGG
jgi:hypothetical protein